MLRIGKITMPKLTKIAAPEATKPRAVKPKTTVTTGKKRGRPVGSKNEKETLYVYGATCKKGCANQETGIKGAEIHCAHRMPMKYLRIRMR
jgi:hypothetical protein